MQKMVFFIAVSVLALSLLGVKGITGYAAADVSVGNFGISMIGLILLAFVFALFTFKAVQNTNVKKVNVWDELARAEEEWQGRKRR